MIDAEIDIFPITNDHKAEADTLRLYGAIVHATPREKRDYVHVDAAPTGGFIFVGDCEPAVIENCVDQYAQALCRCGRTAALRLRFNNDTAFQQLT